MEIRGPGGGQRGFSKQYSVAIDTVPLPERPADRMKLVLDHFSPVLDEMLSDMMTLAIGTWPTPEKPKL